MRRLSMFMAMALLAACGGDSKSDDDSTDTTDESSDEADATDEQNPDDLNPDDAIDIDAPPVSSTDPAQDGESTFTEMTTTIPGSTGSRRLPATVYVPSDAGPRPLIVISPGFQLDRVQYESYARHLATWGFAVVLTDYADRGFFADHAALGADLKKVVDWSATQTIVPVDATKIGFAGHSLGGKISVLAASSDTRVKAVVAWDPVDSTSPSVAPELVDTVAALAVIGETTNATGGQFGMPCAPAAENFQKFYAAAPSPALQMTVNGADHMDWIDDPTCGFVCDACDPGSATPEAVKTLTRRLDVAWFRKQLFADASMDVWLAAPTDGSATVVTK